MRAVAVTVLISSLLGCAGSAQAQGGTAGDVRCFLTMAALTGNKANQPQATFGLFYFAGRIKVQAPNFNFGTDLKPVATKMTKQDLEAEVKRCGPMVQNAVQSLQAAQASLAPPAPPAAPAPQPAPAKK